MHRAERQAGWRADVQYLAGLAALLLAITSIPFIWAYLSSPADRQFMGITFSTSDYSQYMSWARESRDRFFVENKLTSEPNAATFFNPVWWLVGRAERYLGLSFAQLNQILRVLAGFAFVFTLGYVASLLVPRPERRFVVALACVTSGLGWILVLVKQVTGELPAPLLVHAFPGNTFFGMMVAPHMILSASMLLGVFALMLESYRRQCGRRALLAGLLGLALGFAHPYNIATAYSVIGAFAVVATLRDGLRLRWVAAVVAFYALSAPSVLYWLWVSAGSAAWREVLTQYRNLGVFTPDPVQLLVYLGLTAIVAAITFRGFVPLREQKIEDLFVRVWMCVNLLIIYLPLNFQINLLSGIQVPLAILATRVLYGHIKPWLTETLPNQLQPLARFAPALLLVLVLPTNLYLVSWRVFDLQRHTYPDYLHRDDVAALRWLETAAAPTDVVLSSIPIGIYVPGLTGAHAFLAHGANTLRYYEKRDVVEGFFAAKTDDVVRQRALETYGIRYVFYGPSERALGTFDPSTRPYLQPVFTSAETTVYQVGR
jgi:hypothetical protein